MAFIGFGQIVTIGDQNSFLGSGIKIVVIGDIEAIRFRSMTDFMDEVWRPIPDYEGIYSISDFGRVRQERRLVVERGPLAYWQPKFCWLDAAIIKPTRAGLVPLCKDSGIVWRAVSELVLEVFSEPKVPMKVPTALPNKTKAGNRKPRQRCQSVQPKGRSRLTLEQVRDICHQGCQGVPAKVVAHQYQVSSWCIQNIWRGDAWQPITEGIRPKRDLRKFKYLSKKALNMVKDLSLSGMEVSKAIGVHYTTVMYWRRKCIVTG